MLDSEDSSVDFHVRAICDLTKSELAVEYSPQDYDDESSDSEWVPGEEDDEDTNENAFERLFGNNN